MNFLEKLWWWVDSAERNEISYFDIFSVGGLFILSGEYINKIAAILFSACLINTVYVIDKNGRIFGHQMEKYEP